MKRLLIAAIALLLVVVLNIRTGHAEPYPSLDGPASVADTGTADVAVLVAVEDYLLLPDVPGALANANDWEKFLREGLGVRDVRTLSNAQASREDVLSVLASAAKAAPAGAKLWFIFIGHGAPTSNGEDGMLIGMDAKGTPRSLDARGVRSEVINLVEQSDAEPVLVFDACFSGRDASGDPLAPGVQPVLTPATLAAVQESLVFSAAAADQFAGDLPGAGRPAFSYLLLGALRGWGDLDDDGNVTAAEAHRWVGQQLTAITVREQTPQLVGSEAATLTWKVDEDAPPISNIIARNLQKPAIVAQDEPVSEPVSEPAVAGASDGCRDGKVPDATTGEHCCWPGQAWSGDRCVGAPRSCPAGSEPRADSCVPIACTAGKERAADGVHCCWPGQGWSRDEDRCVGEPDHCPAGTEPFTTSVSLAGDGCFVPHMVAVESKTPGARVYANAHFLGVTGDDGSFTTTVPDERHVLSVEKDGAVLGQKRCFEGSDCALDVTRRRHFGVFFNAAGVVLPWSSLLSFKFATQRLSFEIAADAGAVTSDLVKAWYGASAGAAWSAGVNAWDGPLFGVRGGYLVTRNTSVGGGGTTPWLSVGPVVGFRKQFVSGLTAEAHIGARVVSNLDDGQVGGPAIDAAIAIGYAF